MLVEVCCNSLESALNAQKGGADRIELCSELGVGGVTPSHGLIKLTREALTIPIHVLIRPRGGHFTYSDTELLTIIEDIEACKKMGIDGVVVGLLKPDARIDREKMKLLMKHCNSLHVTFHRAFDWVQDQTVGLKQLQDLGIQTVLTSGKQSSVEKGFEQLKHLHDCARHIEIMPGGGVNAQNCSLFKNAGFKAIHLSGTKFEYPVDTHQFLSMNSSRHLIQNEVAVTSEKIIAEVVQSVK